MIKLKTKIILTSIFSTFILSSSIALPIATRVSNSSLINNKNSVLKYFFDNQYFSNLYDATDYAIMKYKPINSDLYWGNANDAIIDASINKVNINKLRKHIDSSRIKPAYKNALGDYEYDYDKAKKSFINKGLVRYYYDDLNGKLFLDKDDAKRSMQSKIYSTPITYQKIKINNDNLIINPLNVDDINTLKIIALQNSIYDNNNFSLSFYSKDNYNGTTGFYSNQTDRLFNFKYAYYELVDYLVNMFLIMKNNFMHKYIKWDVDFKLNGWGKAKDYEIDNFKFDKNKLNENERDQVKVTQPNRKSLLFENISYKDLSLFNSFFTRDKFENQFNIEVIKRKWVLWRACYEKATIKQPIIGTTFNLDYKGDDIGEANGVDITILKKGTESSSHTELRFEINVKPHDLDANQIQEMFNSFISYDSLIKESYHINKYSNNVFINELLKYTWNIIVKELIPNFDNANFMNISFKKYEDPNNNTFIYTNEFYDISDSLFKVPKVDWLESYYIYKYNKNMYNNKISNNNLINDYRYYNNYINPQDELLKKFNLNEVINTNINNLEMIINYNNYPLFKIHDISQFFNLDFESKVSYENKVIDPSQDCIFTINKKLKDVLWNNSISDKSFIINNLDNVSQSFEPVNHDSLLKLKFHIDNNKEVFDSTIDNYGSYLKYKNQSNTDELIAPLLSNLNNIQYNQSHALASYNKALKQKINNNILNSNVTKSMIKPSEIINLYYDNEENNPYLLPYYYAEYLDDYDKFNTSLLYTNITLYYNQKNINEAIKNLSITDPAKVIVVYDLLGNIINPGIKLSKDEELLTTSDAIYDSESIVIDNIFRSKILRPETNKIYYLENDNATYTLLDRQTNLIYNVIWDNKVNYFLAHQDAYHYMFDIVKSQAITIK